MSKGKQLWVNEIMNDFKFDWVNKLLGFAIGEAKGSENYIE